MVAFVDLDVDENGALGYAGKLLVAVWLKDHPELPARYLKAVKRGIARHTGNILHLTVMEPESGGKLGTASRKGLVAALKETASAVDAIATIVPGEGFAAAAYRGIATGILLLVPSMRNLKLAKNMDEIEQYFVRFAPNHEPNLTARFLDQCVTEMRAKLRERLP
jgi:hypothetical protein